MANVVILVPAAGASARMHGADKLLEPVDGVTALRRAAALAARTVPQVVVTLPDGGPHAAPRRAELAGLGVTALPLPDAHEGMAASLRAGAVAAGSADGLMVLLPDMPDITAEDVRLLMAVFADDPACPARLGGPEGAEGHPVIIPQRLFQGLLVLTGDNGARALLAEEETNVVCLDDDRALRDLDTPEAWAAWRAGR